MLEFTLPIYGMISGHPDFANRSLCLGCVIEAKEIEKRRDERRRKIDRKMQIGVT